MVGRYRFSITIRAARPVQPEPVVPAIRVENSTSNSISYGETERVGRPLFSELEIQHRTSQLAKQIALDFQEHDTVVIAVLKGAFVFAADLVRRLSKLDIHPKIDFIRASSYGSKTETSGEVIIEMDATIPLTGKHVLLVDDIIDSGFTLDKIRNHLIKKGVSSVKSCVLLNKPSRREVDFKPDYIGFEIPDYFVVGYGLDYDERYRYLPYITVVDLA